MRVTVGDSSLCCCTCVAYLGRELTPLFAGTTKRKKACCFMSTETKRLIRVGDVGEEGEGGSFVPVATLSPPE